MPRIPRELIERAVAAEPDMVVVGSETDVDALALAVTDPPVPGKTTHAALVSSSAFEPGVGGGFDVGTAGLSIFLYRIVPNAAMRAAWSGVGHVDGRSRLPVDLHYLLTAWADNA